MAIENIAVMSLKPDWSDPITEALAWMTSVTESPQAVEQRMGLRLSPRVSLEVTYTLFKQQRSYFDLLNMVAAGSPIYMPMWYDRAILTNDVPIGGVSLLFDTQYTDFQNCQFAIIFTDAFNFEVVEIASFTDSSLTLAAGTELFWLAGAEVFPIRKCRVESQLSGNRYVDKAFKGTMRFQSLEPNDSISEITLNEYLGNPVLEDEPNEEGTVQYQYDRKDYLLDMRTGVQVLSDVAPFVTQNHSWFAKGRERLSRLRGLLYTLQGRRRPIWVPTFFSDLDLAEDADELDTVLTIKRCGYTDTGGPFLHREHILIHLRDGTRIYRKIIASVIVGEEGLFEEIELEDAVGVDITPDSVLRISFMSFCRLDQDSVELVHHSDTRKGLTTATLVWRTDPGISASFAETVEELPQTPTEPEVLTVIDPFRIPSGKVWAYAPSFGTFAGSDWISIWWGSRRSDEELLESDNPRLPSDVGDVFPTINTPPTLPTTIIVPDTGSFLVRAGLYFSQNGWTTTTIHVRILFGNSTLEPVELNASGAVVIEQLATRVQLASGRDQVVFAKLDPDEPLTVQIQFKFEGTGNLFPISNPDNDPEPYHGKAGSVPGDSYFIVEWWP